MQYVSPNSIMMFISISCGLLGVVLHNVNVQFVSDVADFQPVRSSTPLHFSLLFDAWIRHNIHCHLAVMEIRPRFYRCFISKRLFIVSHVFIYVASYMSLSLSYS